MRITEDMIKANFAFNLSSFRKKAGLTQGELAEKLNYSDKAVSKWERGESVPDIFTLSDIAGLFGITVNELIYEKQQRRPRNLRNHLVITALSIAVVWLVAVVVHFLLGVIVPNFKSWPLFVYAVPVSAIVAIVFSAVWWNKICRFISISTLIWTLPTSIFITFPSIDGMSLIYTIAAVVQCMTILWFLLKKQNRFKRTKNKTSKEKY